MVEPPTIGYSDVLNNPAIHRSARNEPCLIRLPYVCNHDPKTTVFCHGMKSAGGGIGFKPDDLGGAYGCYACHCVVDGHAPRPEWLTMADVRLAFFQGHVLTMRRLRAKGLLLVAGVDI